MGVPVFPAEKILSHLFCKVGTARAACHRQVPRIRHDDAQTDVATTLKKPENTNIMLKAELVLTRVVQTIA